MLLSRWSSSCEVSRRSSHGLLPSQWLLSLAVQPAGGAFHSAWLPSPASFLDSHARHFRELLTATRTRSHVELHIAPAALLPHTQQAAHVTLRCPPDKPSTHVAGSSRGEAESDQQESEHGGCGVERNAANQQPIGVSALVRRLLEPHGAGGAYDGLEQEE